MEGPLCLNGTTRAGTVTIHDRQGIIFVERSFVYEGAAETFFYSDVTHSEHNATIKTGKDLKSKTSWDHDVLTVKTTRSGAVTLETYTLAADGTMKVSVIRPDRTSIPWYLSASSALCRKRRGRVTPRS